MYLTPGFAAVQNSAPDWLDPEMPSVRLGYACPERRKTMSINVCVYVTICIYIYIYMYLYIRILGPWEGVMFNVLNGCSTKPLAWPWENSLSYRFWVALIILQCFSTAATSSQPFSTKRHEKRHSAVLDKLHLCSTSVSREGQSVLGMCPRWHLGGIELALKGY